VAAEGRGFDDLLWGGNNITVTGEHGELLGVLFEDGEMDKKRQEGGELVRALLLAKARALSLPPSLSHSLSPLLPPTHPPTHPFSFALWLSVSSSLRLYHRAPLHFSSFAARYHRPAPPQPAGAITNLT